jgi:hypothetical protein
MILLTAGKNKSIHPKEMVRLCLTIPKIAEEPETQVSFAKLGE